MAPSVTTTVVDGVAVVRLDDGKMNAIGHEVVELLHAALDTAEAEATALCFVGNDRAFSAGFDLAVMTSGAAAASALTKAGAELIMRLYGYRLPTVAAVTGHALAAGALVVLACDTRFVADKALKIGLNEVAIGLPLPGFAVELARERLSKRFATRAVIQAEIFDPSGAMGAGYVDHVVPVAACESSAVEEARRLGQLPAGAYGPTKRRVRQSTIDSVLARLPGEMAAFAAAPAPGS